MRKMTDNDIINKCNPCPVCGKKDKLSTLTYNMFDRFTDATAIKCERYGIYASAIEDGMYVHDSQASAIEAWNDNMVQEVTNG